MFLCPPCDHIYLPNYKLEELGIIALDPINVLMKTGKITKTGTLATTFHKPVGEANLYVQFGYGPPKKF